MPYRNPEDKKAYEKRTGAERQRKYRAKNKEKCKTFPSNSNAAHKLSHRKGNLRRNYGMTLEQYDALLISQGSACAICKTTTPKGKAGRFHVDHNHTTGLIRGLLCHKCNCAIGLLDENPALILAALDYLNKFSNPNYSLPLETMSGN